MKVIVVKDGVTPALRALSRQYQDRGGLHRVMATAGANLVRDHFAALAGSNHNPYGVKSTFWARMRRGTRAEANATKGEVAMPAEAGHRYFGGTIRPTAGRKYLTIPARAEAYGRSAREFDFLEVLYNSRGPVALVDKARVEVVRTKSGRSKRDKESGAPLTQDAPGGLVFFWLVRSATQRADPSVLPTDAALKEAAVDALTTLFRGKGLIE